MRSHIVSKYSLLDKLEEGSLVSIASRVYLTLADAIMEFVTWFKLSRDHTSRVLRKTMLSDVLVHDGMCLYFVLGFLA